MTEKFDKYFKAKADLPDNYLAWPLYGAGLEKVGKTGKPVPRPMPEIRSNEILMRIDACGLCYSDVKAVTLGPSHPRFAGKDLEKEPVVPGHELTMTVVRVGEELSADYHVGERYTMQPNLWINGKSMPFCFAYDGGLRQYTVIGEEILNGDEGNYLIPIDDKITYAASSLAEPWSCVEAAYRMTYRNEINTGGVVWFCGSESSRRGYTIDKIWGNPERVFLSGVPNDLEDLIIQHYRTKGVRVEKVPYQSVIEQDIKVDDILILDGDISRIDAVSEKLNKNGLLVMLNAAPLEGRIKIDMGKLHYDMIAYIGTQSLSIDDAYRSPAVRTELFAGGHCWILGGGGPLGRMHLQRALEMADGPKKILTTNRGLQRLNAVEEDFGGLARKKDVALETISPSEHAQRYNQYLRKAMGEGGFQDIAVMAANAAVVEDAVQYLSKNGVLNLFAGIKHGVTIDVDPWLICGPRQVRLVGHSGSNLDDQIHTVKKTLDGSLKPELSVAAVGGMDQLVAGLQAMIDKKYAGKIIIYPHVPEFPLTGLQEFKTADPEVFESLTDSKFWCAEAEKAFLEKHLAV